MPDPAVREQAYQEFVVDLTKVARQIAKAG